MPRFIRLSIRGVLLIVLMLSAVALWKREEITRLMAVNSLFDADKIVYNFSHMDEAFLNTPITRGLGNVSDLVNGKSSQPNAHWKLCLCRGTS